MTPERLARLFHETYERLAPDFGYRTREASAKPWDDVPEQNRALMTATAAEVMTTLDSREDALRDGLQGWIDQWETDAKRFHRQRQISSTLLACAAAARDLLSKVPQ